MIEITDIRKSLGGQPVLDGVTLNVKKGETVVVIGRSGCGKSVLLKHIIGLMHPDSGSIKVAGSEITSLRGRELYEVRKRFGMLFQGAALFDSLSVWENVGLGLIEHTDMTESEIRRRACDKLALVGLTDIEEARPAELSGGMKKRVGLARAIAMDPEVVLYDEPTTGLDPIMADSIDQLIVRTRERFGVTSIVVTHDMHSAYTIAHRIAMLHEGRIYTVDAVDRIRASEDPIIHRFVNGISSEGTSP
jgi:phospholipid/cholesterol/gamma-HCH transport system ATP-binding protein